MAETATRHPPSEDDILALARDGDAIIADYMRLQARVTLGGSGVDLARGFAPCPGCGAWVRRLVSYPNGLRRCAACGGRP